ncbi:MAG: glycosyltransferase family 25 protein [Limisphaerales bacterium]
MNSLPEAQTLTNPWDWFPLVLCINLKEREDRNQEARAEFKAVNLDRVIFYQTTRRQDRNRGCIDSHMACLRYAVERGVPHVLIFEDDVQFLEHPREKMHTVIQFLSGHDDWKLFYLGGFIFRKVRRRTPEIIQGAVLCTQAYIIKTDFARELLDRRAFFDHPLVSVDLFYSMTIWNSALIHANPLICTQRASASDGTWDSRNQSKAGWLGKAMIYSSLDYAGRIRTDLFPTIEKFKIENGLTFFIFYRLYLFLQQMLIHAVRRALGRKHHPVSPAPGEFIQPGVADPNGTIQSPPSRERP